MPKTIEAQAKTLRTRLQTSLRWCLMQLRKLKEAFNKFLLSILGKKKSTDTADEFAKVATRLRELSLRESRTATTMKARSEVAKTTAATTETKALDAASRASAATDAADYVEELFG